MPQQFKVAGVDGFGEIFHLVAGVVNVVFADDVETGGAQNVDDSGTGGGASAVPDVKQAGGIGADVFDLNRLIIFRGQLTEIVKVVVDCAKFVVDDAGFQVKVHETGAGDFYFVEPRRADTRANFLSDFSGIGAEDFSGLHGEVAGEVAELFLRRNFQRDFRQIVSRLEHAVSNGALNGGVDSLGDLDFYIQY